MRSRNPSQRVYPALVPGNDYSGWVRALQCKHICYDVLYVFIHIYIYILSFFKTYETFPVEIVRGQAREHLTHARARCASTDRRARETRERRQARARGAQARPRCARA